MTELWHYPLTSLRLVPEPEVLHRPVPDTEPLSEPEPEAQS